MTMPRVLMLEDSPLDAELVGAHLDKGGIRHVADRVSTRDEFVEALARHDYQLILADYNLPSFDGLAALAIAREKVPHVAFILVSGTLGEEAAIEAMRNGATDYVVKQRLNKLPDAVKRAWSEVDERVARKSAEHKLEEINATLEAVIEQRTSERDRIWRLGQDLFAVVSLDGTIVSANPAWQTILGYSPAEIEGQRYDTIRHPDDMEKGAQWLEQLKAGDNSTELENRYRHKDGTWRWISWRASPPDRDLIFAIGRDVTQAKSNAEALRLSDEKLLQSQKMESIGQLTGGVAHDFNNLLTVITGNLEYLLRQKNVELTGRERAAVENATRGAERGAALTRSLLAFSRRQALAPKPIALDGLLGGMLDLLKRTLGEQVTIRSELALNTWAAQADANQLENAILNLAVNARDAMGEGGELTISAANVTYGPKSPPVPDLERGSYVVITVADNGPGMPAEVLEQAFDPFFTTKPVGKGTGLGLSQVYGFAAQSGGAVSIDSAPGKGTRVRIYLPKAEGPVAVEPVPAKAAVTDLRSRAGETVLLVEDDADVLNLSSSIVEELGYTVLTATEAEAALALLDAHPEIQLLLTDIVLPNGMDGRQLADEATQRHPGLKVLFASGYSRETIIHNGRLDSGISLIAKPFAFSDLALRLKQALAAADTPMPRVLLVEDEPLIRMIAVEFLEADGYIVEEAETAAQALEMLKKIDGYDAAIVDIGLPDSPGDKLAVELRKIDQALPIIIASGYDENTLRDKMAGVDHVGFVSKPYHTGQLTDILARLGVKSSGQ